MNKVLFGIFLGVLFNIPTFGMSNSLGQYSGIDNNVYCNNNNKYNQTYENSGVQPVFGNITFIESGVQDIACNNIDQNYLSNKEGIYINNNNKGIYININNKGIYINNKGIYINNDTQDNQFDGTNNNYNPCGNINYNSNNIAQNPLVNGINNNFIYDNNDIQYTQFDGTNNNYNSGSDIDYCNNNNIVQNHLSNGINNNVIYINNDTQDNQFEGTNNNYNLGFDVNYDINNIYQNPLSDDINNDNVYNANGAQFNQDYSINISLPTSKKLTMDEFRVKYKDYLSGQIKQLPEKNIKLFCEYFDKLDSKARKQLIKHIKCSCCGSRLVLAGKSNCGKQKVMCKNEKGNCLRVNKQAFLLELNLYAPYVDSFENSYKYYLEGNEQLKKEHVEAFCEEFNKFSKCAKYELIKHMKCGCCRGRLMLAGKNNDGKQMVMCTKNYECERYRKQELLEVNLSSKKVLDVAEYK